jgi:hypothetical protein
MSEMQKLADKLAKVYAEGATQVAPLVSRGTKVITGTAVAVGAVIIATLSGAVTYLLTSRELFPGLGLSAMDLILIAGAALVVYLVYRRLSRPRDPYGYERDPYGPSAPGPYDGRRRR